MKLIQMITSLWHKEEEFSSQQYSLSKSPPIHLKATWLTGFLHPERVIPNTPLEMMPSNWNILTKLLLPERVFPKTPMEMMLLNIQWPTDLLPIERLVQKLSLEMIPTNSHWLPELLLPETFIPKISLNLAPLNLKSQRLPYLAPNLQRFSSKNSDKLKVE